MRDRYRIDIKADCRSRTAEAAERYIWSAGNTEKMTLSQ